MDNTHQERKGMDKEDVRWIVLFRLLGLLPPRYREIADRLLLADSPGRDEALRDAWASTPSRTTPSTYLSLYAFHKKFGLGPLFPIRRVMRYAAILLAIAVPIAGYLLLFPPRPEVHQLVCRTSNGERRLILLPDSSTVMLNAGSTLSYPSQFVDGTRSVTLTGEAMFTVRHDDAQPFVVHADGMEIRDLGTRFGVSCYERGHVTTTLAEGSVKVSVGGESAVDSSFILAPGEQAVYDRSRGSFQMREVSVDNVFAWTHGGLYFLEEPLSTVLPAIGRHYNVSLGIGEGVSPNTPITLQLDSTETLDDALHLLIQITGAKVRHRNQQIVLGK